MARLVGWLVWFLERVGIYEPNPPRAWLEPSWLDREDGVE